MTHSAGAILLAAGAARRMGSCKQLLPLAGKTVIAHCLETLLTGGSKEVIVVVRPEGDEVARAARDYPVQVVMTTDPDGDMAASVRTGRDALSSSITGVMVALCDYPLVTAATISSLIAVHCMNPEGIIIPCHHGRRGHPPLFPRQLLEGLAAPLTLRDLMRANPERIKHLSVADRGVLIDMDTPEDYQRVTEYFNQNRYVIGTYQYQ
ncbi:MAG: nucleotidyltransferase family protein [Desulfocapsaceae bacterium]|nr:nucleotidyltransferase family protein [Desulfocapsaceae bacterium]